MQDLKADEVNFLIKKLNLTAIKILFTTHLNNKFD